MQTAPHPHVEVIRRLTEVHAGGIEPVHRSTDPEHLAELQESMQLDGWIGAPLVVDGEQALTGAHRYDAAQAAEIAIPRVQAADLAAAYGIDWTALLESFGDDPHRWYPAAIALAKLLPADVAEYLGTDLG
jgi:hypothetical protein